MSSLKIFFVIYFKECVMYLSLKIFGFILFGNYLVFLIVRFMSFTNVDIISTINVLDLFFLVPFCLILVNDISSAIVAQITQFFSQSVLCYREK